MVVVGTYGFEKDYGFVAIHKTNLRYLTLQQTKKLYKEGKIKGIHFYSGTYEFDDVIPLTLLVSHNKTGGISIKSVVTPQITIVLGVKYADNYRTIIKFWHNKHILYLTLPQFVQYIEERHCILSNAIFQDETTIVASTNEPLRPFRSERIDVIESIAGVYNGNIIKIKQCYVLTYKSGVDVDGELCQYEIIYDTDTNNWTYLRTNGRNIEEAVFTKGQKTFIRRHLLSVINLEGE